MKLYVVTADTYEDLWGSIIELLRVTDNPEDAQKSSDYARSKGWHPKTEIVEVNKAVRRYLGGCTE